MHVAKTWLPELALLGMGALHCRYVSFEDYKYDTPDYAAGCGYVLSVYVAREIAGGT